MPADEGEGGTNRTPLRTAPPMAHAGTDDLIFPHWHREQFNTILDEENLQFDRDGQPRTAYSLRHTYICLRLMEGADIYQIAKNCRTSVEMIEKYYASHIKTNLDAAAINVMRPNPKSEAKTKQPKTSDGTRPRKKIQPNIASLRYHGFRNKPRGRGGMADAADSNENLSACRETGGAELLKVGEAFTW